MTEPVSKSSMILSLAEELLEDIELQRLDAASLILKASRLARWTGSEKARVWLRFEAQGYSQTNPISKEYLIRTGRSTGANSYHATLYHSLADLEALILVGDRDLDRQLDGFPNTIASQGRIGELIKGHRANMARMLSIRGRVWSYLHEFVEAQYHNRLFSGLAEDVFERYKQEVDSTLADRCGKVLSQLSSVYERLSAGDVEAVSQGLTTCRRMFESMADAINPASNRTFTMGDNDVPLNKENWRARIGEYIDGRVGSKSRRDRMRSSLRELAQRLSTGVHADVEPDEARALLLQTYLILGEIVCLPDPEPIENAIDVAPETDVDGA